MISLETISNQVDVAKSYYLELLAAHRAELVKGCSDCSDSLLDCLGWLITALNFDIKGEYNTDLTQKLYAQLLVKLGGYSGAYVYDPNVVIPGQTIVIQGEDTRFETFNQNALVADDYGTFYLPFSVGVGEYPDGVRIDYATVMDSPDGELTAFLPGGNLKDGVITGFTNNNPQTITVYVIKKPTV